MENRTELKPCPFCGGNAKFRSDFCYGRKYHVECEDCGVKSPHKLISEDAIRAWNERKG